MEDFGSYSCLFTSNQQSVEAICRIDHDSLVISSDNGTTIINFADLKDFRLLNYHLFLETSLGQMELSQLGHLTEAFFEKLWKAYMERSKEALFASESPLYAGEGDYSFTEQGISQHGIAKVELLYNALCLCPHDRYARRIPLCFAKEPEKEPFGLTLTLDTGDTYQIRRIGRDTEAVFERICQLRESVIKKWQQSHKELENNLPERLGEDLASYNQMKSLGCRMISGLYQLDDSGFWFAALKNGKAAVEFVTEEQTATYLYTYDTSDATFEYALRHAMESVGLHREVIFTGLSDKPLYQMTVERNYHLEFLRKNNTGRIIHNAAWDRNLTDFLG